MRIHTLRILAAAVTISLAASAQPGFAEDEDEDWGEYDATCISRTVEPGLARSLRRTMSDEIATMVAVNNATTSDLDMYIYNSTGGTACISAAAGTSEEVCSWTQDGGDERYRILVINNSATDAATFEVCVGIPQ